MLEWTGDVTQSAGGNLAVQSRGFEFLVTKQHLDHADIDTLLQQMGRERMATGIITLLMNRIPIESTTGIIPTPARPSASSGVCDGSPMKRSS